MEEGGREGEGGSERNLTLIRTRDSACIYLQNPCQVLRPSMRSRYPPPPPLPPQTLLPLLQILSLLLPKKAATTKAVPAPAVDRCRPTPPRLCCSLTAAWQGLLLPDSPPPALPLQRTFFQSLTPQEATSPAAARSPPPPAPAAALPPLATAGPLRQFRAAKTEALDLLSSLPHSRRQATPAPDSLSAPSGRRSCQRQQRCLHQPWLRQLPPMQREQDVLSLSPQADPSAAPPPPPPQSQ
jgi:hypothetical protein